MDTIETLIIAGALLAAVGLSGSRIEAIQNYADGRYAKLQAASTPTRIDSAGLTLDRVYIQESPAR
ncbi:MAG: hypothetical protein MUP90_04135 [Gammaproteobacteria bacterium]|nr:hypothetical protein [Gammaproteobacteria bacterium]